MVTGRWFEIYTISIVVLKEVYLLLAGNWLGLPPPGGLPPPPGGFGGLGGRTAGGRWW